MWFARRMCGEPQVRAAKLIETLSSASALSCMALSWRIGRLIRGRLPPPRPVVTITRGEFETALDLQPEYGAVEDATPVREEQHEQAAQAETQLPSDEEVGMGPAEQAEPTSPSPPALQQVTAAAVRPDASRAVSMTRQCHRSTDGHHRQVAAARPPGLVRCRTAGLQWRTHWPSHWPRQSRPSRRCSAPCRSVAMAYSCSPAG